MNEQSKPDLLTVKEVAELLRLKERKIYDLLSNKLIPCTRVAGKWLFPRAHIEAWLAHNSDLPGDIGITSTQHYPAILVGGHDPLIEWALAELDYPFSTQFNGSEDGLNRFAAGEASVCGTHLLDADTGEYNLPLVRSLLGQSGVVVMEWAKREEGIIVAADNPKKINSITDLKTTGARVVERQDGAGSQTLFLQLLDLAGLNREQLNIVPQKAYTHHEVGFAISSDQVDAGIAIQCVAKQMRLGFIPLKQERFDLVIRRRDYFEPEFQQFLQFTKSDTFIKKAESLGGYDISDLGKIYWNSP